MSHTQPQLSQSTTVKMWLVVNGSVLPIAQLGPDFAILAQAPGNHAPALAEIEVIVDDTTDRFAVELPVGMAAGEKRVRISTAV